MNTLRKNQKGGDSIQRSDSIPELETIFTEHWKHARHCENERLWFTNIYVAVVAAILVFMRKICCCEQPNSDLTLVLVIFGLVLSVLGFQVMISLSLGYDHHITDIIMIFYYWDRMEFYRHPGKPFLFMSALRYFHEITIVLFAALTLYYGYLAWERLAVFHNQPVWLIGISLIIFAHVEGLYRWRWEEYIKDNWRFARALRKDTERRYEDWDKWFKDPDFRRKIIEDAKKQKKKKEH
ncbi:MAG: hypothetical protein AYK18_13925 [Theionarchaea archaeon DG-70]|nr:MAG: hypothetical protein AYK18_13925 [Theionarchaea archaeon DG-70]